MLPVGMKKPLVSTQDKRLNSSDWKWLLANYPEVSDSLAAINQIHAFAYPEMSVLRRSYIPRTGR